MCVCICVYNVFCLVIVVCRETKVHTPSTQTCSLKQQHWYRKVYDLIRRLCTVNNAVEEGTIKCRVGQSMFSYWYMIQSINTNCSHSSHMAAWSGPLGVTFISVSTSLASVFRRMVLSINSNVNPSLAILLTVMTSPEEVKRATERGSWEGGVVTEDWGSWPSELENGRFLLPELTK